MASDPRLVQSVFLKAVELPPVERRALLDLECAGDSELRERVEMFLVAHDAPDSFLDSPLQHVIAAGDLTGEPGHAADEFTVEPRVGPYRIVERLGEGGMGSVWVAEQELPIKRRVALKIIKPGMDSMQIVRRFEQERQALALMDHVNIAKILDAGVIGGRDRPYFVMELIKGLPLTTYCDELHLSVRDRLELFVPVCRAIEHAHQKGVIHRDIKPGNVLVCIQDGRPVPKVIDFGIAKAVNQKLSADTVYTGVGVVIGSMKYMSPEQADLGVLDVDTRADVYSLGVLLYELLTGTTPHDNPRSETVGFLATLKMIREEEPPPPSTRLGDSRATLATLAARRRTEPTRLAKEVRGELDWIVMKCLEKDRTRRYDSAAELARDVERYLRDDPVEASPPSTAYRLKKFVRRNRGVVLAAGVVLVSLVFGIIGTTAGMVWAMREQAKAIRSATEEREAKELAERRLSQVERAADLLASIFRNLDPRAVEREGRSLNVILGARLDQAAAQLDGDAIGDPLTVARLQHALGSSYVGLGYPRKAVVLLERARQTREKLLGLHDPDTLSTRNALAGAYLDVGRLKEAVTLYEETLQFRRDVFSPKHPDTLTTLNNLAVAYRDVGRPKDALRHCEEAHRLTTDVCGPLHEDTLMTKSNLASAYRDAGRLREAIRLFEETLRQRSDLLNPKHPDTLRSMSLLAGAYLEANQPEDALALNEKTLQLRREVLGPLHPETLGSMGEVSVALRKLNRLEEAITRGEEALRLRRELLGPTHPHTLTSMNILAVSYREANRLGDALKLFQDTHRLTLGSLGPKHPNTLRTMCNLAAAYRDVGQPKKALSLFREALDLMNEVFEPDHPDMLTCTDHLAGTYLAIGQSEQALAVLDRLLPAQRKNLEDDELRFANILVRFGRQLIDAECYPEAERLLHEALAIREKREPGAWTTFEAELLLGCSLLDRDEFAAAEIRLVHGYAALKRQEGTLPPKGKVLLPDAAERLIELYTAWGKPTNAEKWLSERNQYPFVAPHPRVVVR